MRTALVTGSAGFIGAAVSKALLAGGWRVIGVDSFSNYYDVRLKEARVAGLLLNRHFCLVRELIQAKGFLDGLFELERPDLVIHLAAQAGVRFSIENPRSFLESNINGTFELLEAARKFPPANMLLASSSSVYGATENMPFSETSKADEQLSIYAATKKSTESIAHAYAHLYGLPITMFRFFTVYGPWGRPDMAPFKFVRAIKSGNPIDVYNHGQMRRDFTFIDDLVKALMLLAEIIPDNTRSIIEYENDSLSPVAPFRILNIGNSEPVELEAFIDAMELAIGKKAIRNYMPMQVGDVPETWACSKLLKQLTGYAPNTPIETGVTAFVDWYLSFYDTELRSTAV